MMETETVREIVATIKAGLLAGFGGVVGYLVDVTQRDKPFSWKAYAVFIAAAFLVGQILDSWMPADLPGRGGVLMVAGTAAYPILAVLRAKVLGIVDRMR